MFTIFTENPLSTTGIGDVVSPVTSVTTEAPHNTPQSTPNESFTFKSTGPRSTQSILQPTITPTQEQFPHSSEGGSSDGPKPLISNTPSSSAQSETSITLGPSTQGITSANTEVFTGPQSTTSLGIPPSADVQVKRTSLAAIIGVTAAIATGLILVTLVIIRRRRRQAQQRLRAHAFPIRSTLHQVLTSKITAAHHINYQLNYQQEKQPREQIDVPVGDEDGQSLHSLQESCSSPPSYRS